MTNLPEETEQELAALADGSLAQERREPALARVNGSPELQAILAEQQRAVELTSAVEVGAPASLRHRVESMMRPSRRGHRPARLRIGFVAAAAAGLAAAAVAIGLSAGGSKELTVQEAAALTLSPATMAAPVEDGAHRAELAVSVDGVPFPYWKERFGWRGSGARNDRLGDRSVTTVFYANAEGRRIGYAIASGRAPVTRDGKLVQRWGVSYRVLSHDGATVVTWQRSGHLCVMSGRGVSARTLLSLASWGSGRSRTA